MRIYSNPFDAARETERDLWEMGLDNHPQTMQDKHVGDDEDYATKEMVGYGFKVTESGLLNEARMVDYLLSHLSPQHLRNTHNFIDAEHKDRTSGVPMNPGNSYLERPEVWDEFLHDGKFHYTYSERFAPQLNVVIRSLKDFPGTRQAVMAMHQGPREESMLGGAGRVPCSMYYQFIERDGKLHMIYTMRSCDLLTHFPVDIALALRMQRHIAEVIGSTPGDLTYFCGSLHAYRRDIKARQVF